MWQKCVTLDDANLNTHLEIVESIGRLSVASALGSVIGFERQWHQKMAVLRTNALVALGSCGLVVFSAMVSEGDPTRVAAQVVTGIGFSRRRYYFARRDKRARTQHSSDLVVFRDGGNLRRRWLVGARPGGRWVCSGNEPLAASYGRATQFGTAHQRGRLASGSDDPRAHAGSPGLRETLSLSAPRRIRTADRLVRSRMLRTSPKS
jgi:hypothetical protein